MFRNEALPLIDEEQRAPIYYLALPQLHERIDTISREFSLWEPVKTSDSEATTLHQKP